MAGALSGVRVLELGQLIAGPFAGCMLGSFGAEVIKIEPPGKGDPMRSWRKVHEGTSLWWYSIARNKKSVTVDLNLPEGQTLVRRLVAEAGIDILIENFRPGRMEEWGLGWKELSALNPGLVMVRISGWGQDGPYSQKPGFASVAEGIGGLRYVTGDGDRPPVRTGVSLGDTLAGMHAAFGALAALHRRNASPERVGQVVDTAIYESVFNVMESTLPEYDLLGFVRERSGARLPGIVPSNTYRTCDGKYLIIGGNSDSIFRRLMTAIGHPEMADDARYADNRGRVTHEAEIESAIEQWVSRKSFAEAAEILDRAEVPVGPIYSIADIVKDPQYNARGMFETVELPSGEQVKVPRAVPLLEKTPAELQWPGPGLGAHNKEILEGALGLSAEEMIRLRQIGAI